MSVQDFFSFIISLIVLLYSSGVLINSLTWMGRYLRLSEYTLSFILVAFATSLPEFFIGVDSALQGTPSFSLGNLIGANILDITLVIGVAAILAGRLSSDHLILKEDVQVTIGILLLPTVLALDGTIGRYDGLLLLVVFAGYVLRLLEQDRILPVVDQMPSTEYRLALFFKHLLKFIGGAFLLLVSANFAVRGGIGVAEFLFLPPFFIGILTALGTTLPELIFGIKSVYLRHAPMSLGNALGSIVTNTLFILALVAIIQPIDVPNVSAVLLGIFLTVFFVLLVQTVNFVNGALSRRFGIFLILSAITFLIAEGLLV